MLANFSTKMQLRKQNIWGVVIAPLLMVENEINRVDDEIITLRDQWSPIVITTLLLGILMLYVQ